MVLLGPQYTRVMQGTQQGWEEGEQCRFPWAFAGEFWRRLEEDLLYTHSHKAARAGRKVLYLAIV